MTLEAIALDDRELFAEAMEAGRRARERTGAEADAWMRVCAASYEERHAEGLSSVGSGLMRLSPRSRGRSSPSGGGAALSGVACLDILCDPSADSDSSRSNGADWGRSAGRREAPGLIAQDKFPHDGPVGEADGGPVLDRLGGGEPEGLTVEAAFDMVHRMLVSDPT